MATYNGSEISRGIPARLGVYPVSVNGNINIASSVTLTNGDLLPLCSIPQWAYLADVKIYIPNVDTTSTIRWSLVDNLSSPTTYFSAQTWGNNAASWVSPNVVINGASTAATGMAANIYGTVYGNTARSIGASGAPVVVWALVSGAYPQLQLKVTTTAGAATGGAINIPYTVLWAPAYDAGV